MIDKFPLPFPIRFGYYTTFDKLKLTSDNDEVLKITEDKTAKKITKIERFPLKFPIVFGNALYEVTMTDKDEGAYKMKDKNEGSYKLTRIEVC